MAKQIAGVFAAVILVYFGSTSLESVYCVVSELFAKHFKHLFLQNFLGRRHIGDFGNVSVNSLKPKDKWGRVRHL